MIGSPCNPRDSQESSPKPQFKSIILQHSAFLTVQHSHPYMTIGKTTALTRWTFVGKVMSLLLNMLSRWVITFLPRSKCLLISWLQSPSAVILEPQKIKSDTVSTVSPSISHEVMGPDAMIFVFWMLSVKPTFSLSSFTFIKRLFGFSNWGGEGGNFLEKVNSDTQTEIFWLLQTIKCYKNGFTHTDPFKNSNNYINHLFS